jgi:16S rRNA (guanine527-N7)-methyltransferase
MKAFDRQSLSKLLEKNVDKLNLHLTKKQLEQLLDYLGLLSKWNTVYNLTAVRDPVQMVVQHILDSLAVLYAFTDARNVLDVGAGGGLPGIVLAIARPEMQVSLIDVVHKKTAFLTQVKAELGLNNVHVYTGRVENLQMEKKFDVITSRAFAELSDFVNLSKNLLEDNGRFIAMKGMLPSKEIANLPTGWKVEAIQPIKVPEMDAERHLIFIQFEKK